MAVGLGDRLHPVAPGGERGGANGVAQRLEKQVNWWAAGLLALLIGLLLLRAGSQLPLPQQSCLAVEVGIQNGTLAIALTAGLLQRPELASLMRYVTGSLAIYLGRREATA